MGIASTSLANKQLLFLGTQCFSRKEFILEKDSGSMSELEEIQDQEEAPEQEHEHETAREEAPALRRSGRTQTAPIRHGFLIENEDIQVIEDDEPTSYQDMLSSVDKAEMP